MPGTTMSGRDVKNLLKLAMLVARGKKGKKAGVIDADLIDKIKEFKPT